MRASLRTTVAAALLAGVTLVGSALPAQAADAAREPAVGARAGGGSGAADPECTAPDTARLDAALGGLPDAGTTAALARVGGKGGAWHGSSGVRELGTGREAIEHARFRAGSVTKVVTSALGGVRRIMPARGGLARTSAALSSLADAPRRLPPPPCSCTHQTTAHVAVQGAAVRSRPDPPDTP